MNSMSKGHCQDDRNDCCKREKEVCYRDEKGTKVLLKCGNPGSVILPVLLVPLVTPLTFTVSQVTVNTEDFCDPCIKFEVASNINVTVGVGLPIALNFQIFRNCKNQFIPIPVGPIFTFSRVLSVEESNAFSFFVCDCNVCPDDCCTYTLVMTVPTLGVGLGASVTNATISALVVENDCHSCH